MALPTGYSKHRNLTHVFPSLAASLGADFKNILQLPSSRSAILLLVDGLGLEQLEQFAAHAPFLRGKLKQQTRAQSEMSSVYPSTTAAGLSSLGTGLGPGEHGLIGYDVYDPQRQVVVNQLGGWDERTDPVAWQPNPTIFETLNAQRQAGDHAIEPITVSLSAFEESALTRAALRGPRFVGQNDLAKRFNQAAHEAQHPGALIYLYVNELDKAGHASGPGSAHWLEVLEELDFNMRRLSRKLAPDTLAAVTGDHGMIEVKPEDRIDFSAHGELIEHIAHTAGEPRMVQLHFDSDASTEQRAVTKNAWHQYFGDRAWIATREEAITAGWFGNVADHVRPRIGNLIVTGYESIALYDARHAAPHSFAMVGHHGAPTTAEVRVPWVVFKTP
ncbi:alkaline phosphatase family protein [Yaniella halotolerans]|uniref:alkaline phosphatase family protein n=1 Tax=Yaniella halotolerans TaxID=225453 RepID=UPI0003B6107F|nr:alkaline phosphatase family protein [Yaniella halotolerans]